MLRKYSVELVDISAARCEVHHVVAQHLFHLLQLRLLRGGGLACVCVKSFFLRSTLPHPASRAPRGAVVLQQLLIKQSRLRDFSRFLARENGLRRERGRWNARKIWRVGDVQKVQSGGLVRVQSR